MKKQAKMEDFVREEIARITKELKVSVSITPKGNYEPISFDPSLVCTIRSAATSLGYKHMDIISGAGHDACWTARVVPSAMIFCPCVDGLSHNETEAISLEWAEAGANVLCHAVLKTAKLDSW